LTENQAPFRAVSHNPFLLGNGIQAEPSSMDLEQLRVLAWQQIEPGYLKRLGGLLERYHSAKSRQMASDDLDQVAEATVAGRVGTLLVEADRQIPGRLDEATGRIERGELSHPEIGDILNDLAETVARMKGDVVVVPAERMPSTTGIAATYRF
jgi:Bacterial archaeo-eukaryotic release factor family 3